MTTGEAPGGWAQPAQGPAAGWVAPPPLAAGPANARRPMPHECDLCGFAPAQACSIHQVIGMLVMVRTTYYSGNYCRNCGSERFRKAQNITLIAGWGCVISFFMTVLRLVTNTASAARTRDPGPPAFRDPMVLTPNNPAAPGRAATADPAGYRRLPFPVGAVGDSAALVALSRL